MSVIMTVIFIPPLCYPVVELVRLVFCRDGLELHPASHKPDSEARAECNADLQAATQQTRRSGVLVQKQPAVYSH